MNEAKTGNLVNLFINIIMCGVLGILGQVVTSTCSVTGFFQTYLLTLSVGFFLGTWIPVNTICQKCAHALGIRGETAEYIVSGIITGAMMAVLMCLICLFIQLGTGFYPVFSKLVVPFIVAAVIVTLVFSKPIQKFVIKRMSATK